MKSYPDCHIDDGGRGGAPFMSGGLHHFVSFSLHNSRIGLGFSEFPLERISPENASFIIAI
jgi:hypothetical protein